MELRHIIAARLRLLHRCRCPWTSADDPPDRAFLGRYGEWVAASWLRSRGFVILRRNFRRGRGGEVDIVCREGDTLVFTEVKSSVSEMMGSPSRKVDRTKRNLIRRGARNWLFLLGKDVPIRFDIVEVILPASQPPRIRHIPGAFNLQGH